MEIKINMILVLMAKSGLNLTQFAAKCGIARPTMSRIKRRRRCTPAVLIKMASALNVEPETLIETSQEGATWKKS